jgi:hypothetical protein
VRVSYECRLNGSMAPDDQSGDLKKPPAVIKGGRECGPSAPQSESIDDIEFLLEAGSADWRSLERCALGRLVWRFPRQVLAERFGINDITIRRRCKSLQVAQPPKGYWSRVEAGHGPIDPRSIPFEWRNDALAGARDYRSRLAKSNPCDASEESEAPVGCDDVADPNDSADFGSYVAALRWSSISIDDLRTLVWALPFVRLAAALGVSDVMVHKRCKQHGIETPTRGYWNRVIARQPVDESGIPEDLVRYARRCRDDYSRGLPVPRPPGKLSDQLLNSIKKWVATLPEASRVARRSHLKTCLLTAGYSTVSEVRAITRPALKLLQQDLEEQYAKSTSVALNGALKKYRTWLVEGGEQAAVSRSMETPRVGFDAIFDGSPRAGEDQWLALRDAAMMCALFLGDTAIEELCSAPRDGWSAKRADDLRVNKSIKSYRAKVPEDLRGATFLFLTDDGAGVYRKLVERVIAERTKNALGRRLSLTELRALLKLNIPPESLALRPG